MALGVVDYSFVWPPGPRFRSSPGHFARVSHCSRGPTIHNAPAPPFVFDIRQHQNWNVQRGHTARHPAINDCAADLQSCRKCHTPKARSPQPPDEPLERRRCKNAAVLAAPPDTPQTTNVDCLSTYSKPHSPICTRALCQI